MVSKKAAAITALVGSPPANLDDLASTPGWMDDQLKLIGTTRRKVALARGVAPATLQNYATRPGSRVPPDLALWIWEEVQWRKLHPVPMSDKE